jgi:hypothetical protein
MLIQNIDNIADTQTKPEFLKQLFVQKLKSFFAPVLPNRPMSIHKFTSRGASSKFAFGRQLRSWRVENVFACVMVKR